MKRGRLRESLRLDRFPRSLGMFSREKEAGRGFPHSARPEGSLTPILFRRERGQEDSPPPSGKRWPKAGRGIL